MKSIKTINTSLTRSEKNTFSKRTSLRPKKSFKGSKSLRPIMVSNVVIKSEQDQK